MGDLLKLDACRTPTGSPVPMVLRAVHTPLRWDQWDRQLETHPDQRFREFIVRGIREGFRVGFDYQRTCRSSRKNMHSAEERSQVVHEYLQTEISAGRILGPLDPANYPQIHTSSFGVIPKSTPGKWRLIVDMSSPSGGSVNDGINESLCSLSYVTIRDGAQGVATFGRGTMMAKVDIRNAYRVVPVNPDDRWLMGMIWHQKLYIDTALPFGLRSAPKIFTALADAIEWIAKNNGIQFIIHYLDDFLLLGAPGSQQCTKSVTTLMEILQQLGMPVAWDKLEGPAPRLTFLGFELDSINWEIRLPREKLKELQDLVERWSGRRSCTRRELESLVGRLTHASRVITFLRRLFELLAGTRQAHHHIRLNSSYRSDLLWWSSFMETWNGISMIPESQGHSPIEMWTDASGSYGCGAISTHLRLWIQLQWPSRSHFGFNSTDQSILWKELVPIVIACAVWARYWRGRAVIVHCDNTGAVAVVNSGYSRESPIMHLLRCLFFIRATYQFSLYAVHISGSQNSWADALSRGHANFLHTQVGDSTYQRSTVPGSLITLLMLEQPDWTSRRWIQLYRDSLHQV